MRKILLLSDTHGFLDEKIIKYANTVDEIWHAGDVGDVTIIDRLKQIKPLKGVYGNIDNHEIRKELPLDCKFYCENIYVWITHIGGYPNRYKERIKEYNFQLGDLVKYVRVEESDTPQVWKRTGGVGILVGVHEVEEGMPQYTVMTNGMTHTCLEVFHVESSTKVCNVYEFENIS